MGLFGFCERRSGMTVLALAHDVSVPKPATATCSEGDDSVKTFFSLAAKFPVRPSLFGTVGTVLEVRPDDRDLSLVLDGGHIVKLGGIPNTPTHVEALVSHVFRSRPGYAERVMVLGSIFRRFLNPDGVALVDQDGTNTMARLTNGDTAIGPLERYPDALRAVCGDAALEEYRINVAAAAAAKISAASARPGIPVRPEPPLLRVDGWEAPAPAPVFVKVTARDLESRIVGARNVINEVEGLLTIVFMGLKDESGRYQSETDARKVTALKAKMAEIRTCPRRSLPTDGGAELWRLGTEVSALVAQLPDRGNGYIKGAKVSIANHCKRLPDPLPVEVSPAATVAVAQA